MSVLEAMASALPIVATRVGGIPDIVTEGINGLLVDAGQPEQLADAIHKLYVDNELNHEMRRQSYRYAAEHHDVENYVTELLGIYEKTLLAGKAIDSFSIR